MALLGTYRVVSLLYSLVHSFVLMVCVGSSNFPLNPLRLLACSVRVQFRAATVLHYRPSRPPFPTAARRHITSTSGCGTKSFFSPSISATNSPRPRPPGPVSA